MPASADLLKVLAENPKSLQQDFGCMTGIFQIFDRQQAFIGRRYGSKRVSNASGQSQPASACESPRHDRSNPYWMFEPDSSRKVPSDDLDRAKASLESTKEHQRAYSDCNSENVTKSFEAPTESRTSVDQKSQLDQSSTYSEESAPGLQLYYNEPPREITLAAKEPLRLPQIGRREYYEPAAVSPRASIKDPSKAIPDSIRDIVRASFQREKSRDPIKEKPRASVDGYQSHSYLKNLPRSSSVDGRVASRPSLDGREEVARQAADLPRSCSVDGRGGYLKDGFWSSSGSPRVTREKDLTKPSIESRELPRLSVARNLRDSIEERVVTRLTMELKEGPRLSVSKDDRRAVTGRRDSSSLLGPYTRYAETRDQSTTAFDFRDSLRAADLKDSLRAVQKVRDGPRFSVDGTRDAPRASIAPRLSVDGRDSAQCALPRRFHRDAVRSSNHSRDSNEYCFPQQRPEQDVAKGVECEARRRVPNVVARLMGLEELPSFDQSQLLPPKPLEAKLRSDEASLYQQHLQGNPQEGSPPPPPPCQLNDYNYDHRRSDVSGGFRNDFSQYQDTQVRFASHQGNYRPTERGSHSAQSMQNLEEYIPDQESWHNQREHNEHYSQMSSSLSPKHHVKDVAEQMSTQEEAQQLSPQQTAQPPGQVLEAPSTSSKSTEVEKMTPSEPLCDDTDQKLCIKSSVQGRKTLRQILEAMHLKTLLRRRQSEGARAAQNELKKAVKENHAELLDLKQQQLPLSRLTIPRVEKSEPQFQEVDPEVTVLKDFISTDAQTQEGLVEGTEHAKSMPLHSHDIVQTLKYPNEEASIVMMKPIITRSKTIPPTSNSTLIQSGDTVLSNSSISGRCNISTAQNLTEGEILPSVERQEIKSVICRAVSNELPLRPQQVLRESGHETSAVELEASSSLRKSRKERIAARTPKVSSDLTQHGRDSSPRGHRSAPVPQEKPRPCSPREPTPLSPRCPGATEMNRLGATAKVREKRFVVKDREENKSTFAHLRANATKHEFLRGRASGDPDTPRLRRNSSGSDLLSTIAMKHISAGGSASKSVAGQRVPTDITVLRSSRSLSKPNKAAVKSRVTAVGMKTVPRSKLQKDLVSESEKVRPGTAAHTLQSRKCSSSDSVTIQLAHATAAADTRPTSINIAVTLPKAPLLEKLLMRKESTCLERKEEQVSSSSILDMRMGKGEAVDHSGDGSLVNYSDAVTPSDGLMPLLRLQSEVQTARVAADEEEMLGVQTPRGVSLRKSEFPDSGSNESVDQPSPVSVLDNFQFEEEFTPSPRAGKTSVLNLQDAYNSLENEGVWRTATMVNSNLEIPSVPTPLKAREASVAESLSGQICISSKCNIIEDFPLLKKAIVELQLPTDSKSRKDDHRKTLGTCLGNFDDERAYVRDLVVASGLIDESSSPHCLWSATGYIIDPSIFDRLQQHTQTNNLYFVSQKRRKSEVEREKEALDRRVLFDSVNEIMDKILEPHLNPLPLTGIRGPQMRTRPAGRRLIQEVWDKLQSTPCPPSEDVVDTVYSILQKDMVTSQDDHWLGCDGELVQVCAEIERMIVKDLVEETVGDLCGVSSHKFSSHKFPPLPFAATRRQLFAC